MVTKNENSLEQFCCFTLLFGYIIKDHQNLLIEFGCMIFIELYLYHFIVNIHCDNSSSIQITIFFFNHIQQKHLQLTHCYTIHYERSVIKAINYNILLLWYCYFRIIIIIIDWYILGVFSRLIFVFIELSNIFA